MPARPLIGPTVVDVAALPHIRVLKWRDDMAQDMEQLTFCGKVYAIAEDELNASIPGDSGLDERLYREYQEAGKPRNVKAWIRERLEPLFLYVDKPPDWVGPSPMWPWMDGKPMVFIRQFDVPESGDVAERVLRIPGRTLYVFAAFPVSENDTMRYHVVEAARDTKYLRMVPNKPL